MQGGLFSFSTFFSAVLGGGGRGASSVMSSQPPSEQTSSGRGSSGDGDDFEDEPPILEGKEIQGLESTSASWLEPPSSLCLLYFSPSVSEEGLG